MPVTHIHSKEEFESLLQTTTIPIIVDFYADFCGPCKMIAPFIHSFANSEVSKYVMFAKVDVEEVTDLAEQLNVQAMPTFIAFHNKNEIKRMVGASKEKITTFIKDVSTMVA